MNAADVSGSSLRVLWIYPLWWKKQAEEGAIERESHTLSALCRRGKVHNPVDGFRCHRRKGAGSKGRSKLRRSEAGMASSSPPTTAAAPGFGVFPARPHLGSHSNPFPPVGVYRCYVSMNGEGRQRTIHPDRFSGPPLSLIAKPPLPLTCPCE